MKVTFFDMPSMAERHYLHSGLKGFDVFFTRKSFNEVWEKHHRFGKFEDSDILCIGIESKMGFDQFKETSAKLIITRSTGTDHMDMTAAKLCGKTIINLDYSRHSVAQHVFYFILQLARKKNIELYGKGIGIVGFGRIGIEVAAIADKFGMRIMVNDIAETQDDVEYVDLKTLLVSSDVVSLNCPLSNNHHMIGEKELALLRDGAILINTARGGLIDTKALLAELRSKRIYAGLDVFEGEEKGKNGVIYQTLKKLDNAVVTCHCAARTKEARRRLLDNVIAQIKKYKGDKDGKKK